MKLVTVGLLVPGSDIGIVARAVRGSGLGTVVVEAMEYPRSKTDPSVRRFLEALPGMIFVDGQDSAAATEAVRVLHLALPAAWIVVCTSVIDAQVILEFIRGGAREIVPNATQASLTYALRHYIEERERENKSEDRVKGRVFAVCAGKRGVGATTVAINLAAFLSEIPGARAALIDLDWPVGDAAAYLNIVPRFTIANALSSVDRLDSVLLESYMHKHEDIYVLPGFETFESDELPAATRFAMLIEIVARLYTHIVVDLPTTLNRELVATVTRMSESTLAVVTPELSSLRRTERLLRFFGEFELPGKIRLVLNRARKTNEITDSAVEKALGQPVSWKISNDYYACAKAVDCGATLLGASSKNLVRDYREMSRQLAGFQIDEKRRGLLNFLARPALMNPR